MTRIKPELQRIMQKFEQDKKPSNLKVLTSSDDAKTFGSPVIVRNILEVKFKFENSYTNAVNIRRTEKKTENHQEIKAGRKRKFGEEEANKKIESPRMTRNKLDCKIDGEKNSCSKTSVVQISNQGGGLVKKIVEKFGNNSTCSNLPFNFEVKKTFDHFERAKIQPGWVNKGDQPIKKIGTELPSSDLNKAKTASHPIGRSLGLFQGLSNGKMPTNVGLRSDKK